MRKKQTDLMDESPSLLHTEQLQITLSTTDRQRFCLAFSTGGLSVYVVLTVNELTKLGDRLLNAVAP